ncbi:aspartyl protease family protein [Sphingomonas soli]|uniref:aspartyl protease family protein n=1 Tax=Sphingomonas soli TaxID=266127 RepID=UPI00082F792E|nr:aspartyl protease family protein [Sphingomonas soli]
MLSRRSVIGGGAALAAGVPFGRALAAAGRPPFISRIVLENGRVWIGAMLDGKGPFFFVLDTGSGLSFIEDSFARRRGLSSRPGQRRFGIGGGVSEYSNYVAKEVRLASGIRFNNMVFAGTRDGLLGADLVGGFGSGLFTSYDSDLDFVKGEWRAYTDGRPDFAGLSRVKSRFTMKDVAPKIVMDAQVDGFAGEFIMDTGFSRALSLDGRATAKSGLWDDSRPYVPTEARGFGAAGIPTRLVRAEKLSFGGHAIERPLVSLSAPGTISHETAGLIGLEAIGRFHLTTRVSDGSLWIAPNGLTPRAFGYRLSGLWLTEKGGQVTISDVGTGSPAAAAGVKKGDVLKGGDLSTLIRNTNGAPGKQVTLEIERGGAAQTISYTLRPWL